MVVGVDKLGRAGQGGLYSPCAPFLFPDMVGSGNEGPVTIVIWLARVMGARWSDWFLREQPG